MGVLLLPSLQGDDQPRSLCIGWEVCPKKATGLSCLTLCFPNSHSEFFPLEVVESPCACRQGTLPGSGPPVMPRSSASFFQKYLESNDWLQDIPSHWTVWNSILQGGPTSSLKRKLTDFWQLYFLILMVVGSAIKSLIAIWKRQSKDIRFSGGSLEYLLFSSGDSAIMNHNELSLIQVRKAGFLRVIFGFHNCLDGKGSRKASEHTIQEWLSADAWVRLLPLFRLFFWMTLVPTWSLLGRWE